MKMKKYKTIIGNHACATFIIAISMFKLKIKMNGTQDGKYYEVIQTHSFQQVF